MNKQRYLDSEMHRFCKSLSCSISQIPLEESYSTNVGGANLSTAVRESWLGMLHLVTLKHSKNPDFSICDEIFEPLELIHIAYLLSAAESIPISANPSGSINLQSITQSKVKQKITHYSRDASLPLANESTYEANEFTDDGIDIPAVIQLQIIVRQIILRFPESAYDALLVLNEMQRESRRNHESDGERISMRRESGGGSFLDICVSVGHSLSLCDTCSDNSDRFRDNKDGVTATDGREYATTGLIRVLKGHQCSPYYKTALQDSLLKLLLEAEDVMGVATMLCRWSRFTDLRIFTDRVWGSVQFILGEHEQKDEYYSSPVSCINSDSVRPARIRRPIPLLENILEIAHLDRPDGFIGHDDDGIVKEEGKSGERETVVSAGEIESARNGFRTSLITEDNKRGDPSASRSISTDTIATPGPGLSPKCCALPANSNQLLRRRLMQFAAIQQLMVDAATPSGWCSDGACR